MKTRRLNLFEPGSRSIPLLVAACMVAPLTPAVAADNWVGTVRCEVKADAPGYSHQEIQTWTLTGAAPAAQGAMMVYPATWTVTGEGSHDRTVFSNRRIATWAASVPVSTAPVSAPVAFRITPAGELFAQLWHSQLSAPRGYTGTDQYINNGVAQPERELLATVYEWQFARIPGSPADTKLVGSNTTELKAQVGPLQPPGSQAKITCAWALGKGSAPTLPPSAVAPATPPPAGDSPAIPQPQNPPGGPSPPAGTPTDEARLLSVSQTSVEQGAYGSIFTLTGANTHWQTGTPVITIEPDVGAPVTDLQTTSPTELVARIPVQFSTSTGPRSITVTTGSEIVTLANAFTVTPREKPELLSVIPSHAKPGDQNLTLQLTGRATHWTQGDLELVIRKPFDASKADAEVGPLYVTVQSTAVHSPTSATVVVNIAADATTGPYWIMVFTANPSDSVKIVDGFTMDPGPVAGGGTTASPATFTIEPDHAEAGQQNVTVTFTGTGTHWAANNTRVEIARPRDALLAGNPTIHSPTRMTATVNIPGRQAPNTQSVMVRTSLGGSAAEEYLLLPEGFAVMPASIPDNTGQTVSNAANESSYVAIPVGYDVTPTAPYTDQWWQVGAEDDPASTTAMLRFSAAISGGAAGRTYDIEISEQTPSGRVNRSLSETSHTPRAGLSWSNVAGSDDSKTFFVRVHHSGSVSSTEKYRLTLEWGGPGPTPLETAVVVPIIPLIGALPADPANFVAAQTADGTVWLSWNPVKNATSYEVRGPGTGSGATVTGTSYTVTGLPAGAHTWTVASKYNPGGVLTEPERWSKASATVVNSGAIQIYGPPAGQPLTAGWTIRVLWAHQLPINTSFDVDLSTDRGATWKLLRREIATQANQGSSVNLPTVVTDAALFRVRATSEPSKADVSDQPFAIRQPTITLTSVPASMSIGATSVLRWRHTLPRDSYNKFYVYVSRDGGTSWEYVKLQSSAGKPDGTESMAWTVTGPATNRARIKVVSNLGNPPLQVESADFLITP